jgi:hypothetical protein
MNFDRLGIVIDWLDACRARKVVALLELYDSNAMHIEDSNSAVGLVAVKNYWNRSFANPHPEAFKLYDIQVQTEWILLDYSSVEGTRVQLRFEFSDAGKIKLIRRER